VVGKLCYVSFPGNISIAKYAVMLGGGRGNSRKVIEQAPDPKVVGRLFCAAPHRTAPY
jgi:hypothetical protein